MGKGSRNRDVHLQERTQNPKKHQDVKKTPAWVKPVVSILAHCTGVEDDNVCLRATGDWTIACAVQQSGESFGVMDIHLAAVGLHLIRLRDGSQCDGFLCHSDPSLAMLAGEDSRPDGSPDHFTDTRIRSRSR